MCQHYKAEANMIKHNILFIGLDTHKTFTEVGYNEDQRCAKATLLGKYLVTKLHLKSSPNNFNLNTLTRHSIFA